MERRTVKIVGIGVVRCPRCKDVLRDENLLIEVREDCIDVDFECSEGHRYFVRVKPADWIDAD